MVVDGRQGAEPVGAIAAGVARKRRVSQRVCLASRQSVVVRTNPRGRHSQHPAARPSDQNECSCKSLHLAPSADGTRSIRAWRTHKANQCSMPAQPGHEDLSCAWVTVSKGDLSRGATATNGESGRKARREPSRDQKKVGLGGMTEGEAAASRHAQHQGQAEQASRVGVKPS